MLLVVVYHTKKIVHIPNIQNWAFWSAMSSDFHRIFPPFSQVSMGFLVIFSPSSQVSHEPKMPPRSTALHLHSASMAFPQIILYTKLLNVCRAWRATHPEQGGLKQPIRRGL